MGEADRDEERRRRGNAGWEKPVRPPSPESFPGGLPAKPGHEGLTGHDESAPPQEGFMTFGGAAKRAPSKEMTIASFSAEQTARFLSGGQLGDPTYHDASIARRQCELKAKLREALYEQVVPALAQALEGNSDQARTRLLELASVARSGDPGASQLLGAMLGELLTMGLRP